MLTISGLKNFYNLPSFLDMRCKAPRVSEIIRSRYHRDPLDGDVYIFMFKDPKKVKMIHYERHAYYLHEKSFTNGYRFMRSELYDLLALPEEEMSDLMRTALIYLHKFWNQLFAYRKDGEYTIDNLVAERAIRPLTVQRKNSLFFYSTKGALRSAVYNTFIETCKQAGISFRSFFCKYMAEIRKGRTDYENLLPMTISLTN